MSPAEIIIKIGLWVSGIMVAGTIAGIAWVVWVYVNDLESHSELTEKEEEEMLRSESFRNQNGGGLNG